MVCVVWCVVRGVWCVVFGVLCIVYGGWWVVWVTRSDAAEFECRHRGLGASQTSSIRGGSKATLVGAKVLYTVQVSSGPSDQPCLEGRRNPWLRHGTVTLYTCNRLRPVNCQVAPCKDTEGFGRIAELRSPHLASESGHARISVGRVPFIIFFTRDLPPEDNFGIQSDRIEIPV